MMTVAALAFPTILGFLVISVVLRNETESGLSMRVSLAYPLGMGLLTMQMFLLALMRVPLKLGYVASLIVIEIVGLFFLIRKKKIGITRMLSCGFFKEIASADVHWSKKILVIVLTAIVVVKIGSIFVETYLRPIFAWDSFANWSAGAKAFYYSHSLLLDTAPQDFFGKGILDRNANYPPHNPLMQVWMGFWIGNFDEVLVKFWSPVYLLAMSLYLYEVMARETSRLVALSMLVLFLSSPLISVHAIEVYSDVPLSVYLLFSLIMFLFAMRGEHEYWALIGLYSAEALFTKDEAPFFVIPLILAAIIFYWQNRRQGFISQRAVIALFAGLLPAVPWFIFKFTHHLGFGADYIRLKWTIQPQIAWRVVMMLLSFRNFNVFFLIFPLLLMLTWRQSKEFIFLLVPMLCYALFFMLVYTLTEFYAGGLMFDTAVFRNIMSYYPIVCLLTSLLIKDIMMRGNGALAPIK